MREAQSGHPQWTVETKSERRRLGGYHPGKQPGSPGRLLARVPAVETTPIFSQLCSPPAPSIAPSSISGRSSQDTSWGPKGVSGIPWD